MSNCINLEGSFFSPVLFLVIFRGEGDVCLSLNHYRDNYFSPENIFKNISRAPHDKKARSDLDFCYYGLQLLFSSVVDIYGVYNPIWYMTVY